MSRGGEGVGDGGVCVQGFFGGALQALELGLLVGGEPGWGGRGLEG